MSSPQRFDRAHTDDLMSYLAASPSPYHAVANAAARLEEAGFRQVEETAAWDASAGGKYVLRGGAIVAWYVPEGAGAHTPFRIAGAHTDSPNLRVKPLPDTGAHGWRQIAVEVYGGTLLNTWLDRDLGLAGRISLRDGTHRLVNIDRALLRVPQLAVHLDRSANTDGLKLDRQKHMQPIWGLGDVEEGDLIRFVAEEAGVAAEDVTGWDLMPHAIEPPSYLGRDRELVAGPRMDNLLSVHAATAALAAVAAQDDADIPYIPVLAAFDHEENGSQSDTGADGPLLGSVLERSVFARGGTYEDRARAFAKHGLPLLRHRSRRAPELRRAPRPDAPPGRQRRADPQGERQHAVRHRRQRPRGVRRRLREGGRALAELRVQQRDALRHHDRPDHRRPARHPDRGHRRGDPLDAQRT